MEFSLQFRRALVLVLGTTSFGFSQTNFAPQIHGGFPGCDNVLLTHREIIFSEDSQESLHWLNLITESNYEAVKHNASATVPGYFDGTYNDFLDKRKQVYSEKQFDHERTESRSFIQRGTPPEAFSAWKDCITRINRNTLLVWADKFSGQTAIIGLTWDPEQGFPAIQKLRVEVNGKPLQSLPEFSSGSTNLTIDRDPNGVSIVSVTATLDGGASRADAIEIPPDLPGAPSLELPTACPPYSCITEEGTCGVVLLSAHGTNRSMQWGWDVTAVRAEKPLEKKYSISSKIKDDYFQVRASWTCQQAPGATTKVERLPACSCITDQGKCGAVSLEAGCTRDQNSWGCDVTPDFTKPNTNYDSGFRRVNGSYFYQVGVSWTCQ